MSDTLTSSQLVEEIAAKGSITADDVLRLRREVFKDGVVDPMEARDVFRLDHACETKDGTWTQFYVDVLTDFFVWQSQPRGYVQEDMGKFLIENIAGDGRVDSSSELELLINVIHWAKACPPELVQFVLKAVRESVLEPATAAYGSNRPPSVISPADVEIIRKVIYAGASGGGLTVTRTEAELIFDLNDATIAAENAPSWSDLFVKAIANHLMFPRGAPVVASADEALRREAWLKDRRGVGRLLSQMGGAIKSGDIPIREAFAEADVFGTRAAKAEREREDARVSEALSKEAIDQAEAKWLSERINRDGTLHETERKLLQFIKQNSPSVDPLLDELFAKAGL